MFRQTSLSRFGSLEQERLVRCIAVTTAVCPQASYIATLSFSCWNRSLMILVPRLEAMFVMTRRGLGCEVSLRGTGISRPDLICFPPRSSCGDSPWAWGPPGPVQPLKVVSLQYPGQEDPESSKDPTAKVTQLLGTATGLGLRATWLQTWCLSLGAARIEATRKRQTVL